MSPVCQGAEEGCVIADQLRLPPSCPSRTQLPQNGEAVAEDCAEQANSATRLGPLRTHVLRAHSRRAVYRSPIRLKRRKVEGRARQTVCSPKLKDEDRSHACCSSSNDSRV
eukprot:6173742-Pleurochrysis_carterae.AAC.3